MEQVQFADGTRYDCASLVYSPSTDTVYICLANVTPAEAARIFSDAQALIEIVHNGDRFLGYVDFRMMTVHPYGIEATLRRATA